MPIHRIRHVPISYRRRLSTRSAGYQRQQLFLSHELADQVVPALLHVFVSIEMTGQSVQFEEKFNYRRPMYVIMKYLWSVERHRNMFL